MHQTDREALQERLSLVHEDLRLARMALGLLEDTAQNHYLGANICVIRRQLSSIETTLNTLTQKL